MPASAVTPAAAILVLLLATGLVACGPSDSAAGPAGTAASRETLDRCALLSDEEVSAAIGAHHGGHAGDLERPSVWGGEGCRWTAVAVLEITGYGNWSDAIDLAVFDKSREPWYRAQAEGEPVDGLGAGALYDESTGELWFECGDGRFCAIKAHTASGDGRQQLAQGLAKLVQGRMSRR